jgi:hypothetical protein
MWWNDVLKVFEPRMSPAKMHAKYGGVFSDWVDENSNAKTNGNWNWQPDVSAVVGTQTKYWTGTSVVTEMTQAEKDGIDAAEQAAQIAEMRAALRARFDQQDDNTRALGLLMLELYQLIRAELKPAALNNPLPDITAQQLKTRFLAIVDDM